MIAIDRNCILNAWRGRISGCLLGKPVEVLSMMRGYDELTAYLRRVDALPLRDYVPHDGSDTIQRYCCRGHLHRAEPDDDINYSVLALQMLERYGSKLQTEDVARTWLMQLPVGMVFTAERDAYLTLANRTSYQFALGGGELGFDIAECSDNPYNTCIGAQIRTDVYGWVCPGDPAHAASLARMDAELSHRDEGVEGAAFVAAFGAAIPIANSLDEAAQRAITELRPGSAAVEAVEFGRTMVRREDAVSQLHAQYGHLPAVHTLNNLALVVWALLSNEHDFSAAIGDAVAAGWDTDCNGATVGGLWGVTGRQIPTEWTDPWHDRVAVTLAGQSELALGDLVDRTEAVAKKMAKE